MDESETWIYVRPVYQKPSRVITETNISLVSLVYSVLWLEQDSGLDTQ